MANNKPKTSFKNLTNKTQGPGKHLMKTNRPQGPIAQKKNGGAAAFENKRNSTNPNHKAVKAAVKSGATTPASGGTFKRFIGGK